MLKAKNFLFLLMGIILVFGIACQDNSSSPEDENPFLEDANADEDGKEDTGWQTSLNALEVEFTMEADIEADQWSIKGAPPDLAQFALTYLRQHNQVYIESLAEDPAFSDRVEWLINGEWVPADNINGVDTDSLTHFRLVRVNGVIRNPGDVATLEGKTYEIPVPLKPYEVMSEAGDSCADESESIELADSTYWYLWDPEKRGCTATIQNMKVTVATVLPQGNITYPEYDRLIADGQISAIVFFGQLGHGEISESDAGFRKASELGRKLEAAGFTKGTSPDGLIRYTRQTANLTEIVDISRPSDFAGLTDYANVDNFDKGIKDHEIVVYDGHSVLGASSFWSRNIYNDDYQIFFFNGCLGYEYYVRPILNGKDSWDNVDLISNLVETPGLIGPNVIAAMLTGIFQGAENSGNVSWQKILENVNKKANSYFGESYYGASGIRTNCFSPSGSLCGTTTTDITLTNTTAMDIPDNDQNGITSTINADQTSKVSQLTVELNITHTYVGDLLITLEHNGTTETIWNYQGGYADNIVQSFTFNTFAGADVNGAWNLKVVDAARMDTGTLNNWTLKIKTN